MYRWMNVSMTDLENNPECAHRAYVDDEKDWNGWLCPLFKKSEVARMTPWLRQSDVRLLFDDTTDKFVAIVDSEATETFGGIDIDGMHLYPIGYGSWMWVESTCSQAESG